MAMVTFLSTVVSKDVAASAAKSALETFVEKRGNESLQVAANAALAAATIKAQVIAEKEEREIYTLVSKAIDLQLKKIELKMKAFDDIDQLVEREKIQIERARQGIVAEVMNVAQKMRSATNVVVNQ